MALVALATNAQVLSYRVPCMPGTHPHGTTRTLTPKQDWDASRTYRQLVLLVQYADQSFTMNDPQTYYHNLFNVTSSNTRGGVGCVADYFRHQSNGVFNLQFDVVGPIKVSQSVVDTSSAVNLGHAACSEAIQKAVDSLHIDFSVYDWDGNHTVEQIVFVMAGYGANGGDPKTAHYVWPNTEEMNTHITGPLYVNYFTISAEKWFSDELCGIGTICHEFSHCLGLPDLYPSDGKVYSTVDEWDLMDGGNYSVWGWCPPNYSAFEKYLLGWLSFEEITGPVSVSGMKPVADGGKAYKIVQPRGERSDAAAGEEFYLLENRQQEGWDRFLPGKGLVIVHVKYDDWLWRQNTVNKSTYYRYQLVPADGMDYQAWDDYLKAHALTDYLDTETRQWNRHLSTAAYPLMSDDKTVNSCDALPLPITHIQLSDDGTISFDVVSSAIHTIVDAPKNDDHWYDLQGRRLIGRPTKRGLFINNGRKILQ